MPSVEVLADAPVSPQLVGGNGRARVNTLPDGILQVLATDAGNHPAVNSATPLHHSEHRCFVRVNFLRPRAVLAGSGKDDMTGFATNVGFIAFYHTTQSAQFWACPRLRRHRKANAVHQEQGRRIADLALPLNFQCAYALLGRDRSPKGIRPMSKWYPRFLQNRANPDCELLFAGVAAPQEPLAPLAGLGVLHLVNIGGLTMRAARRSVPYPPLKKFHRRKLVRAYFRHLFDDFRLLQVRPVRNFLHATTLNLTQGFRYYNF